jgi:hypothetical protein
MTSIKGQALFRSTRGSLICLKKSIKGGMGYVVIVPSNLSLSTGFSSSFTEFYMCLPCPWKGIVWT